MKVVNLTVEEQPTGEITLGAGAGTGGTTIGGGVKEKLSRKRNKFKY